jgi:hypothetical protein
MKGATPLNTSRAHDTAAMLTHVELTWHKQRVEHRIRFGRQVGQQVRRPSSAAAVKSGRRPALAPCS